MRAIQSSRNYLTCLKLFGSKLRLQSELKFKKSKILGSQIRHGLGTVSENARLAAWQDVVLSFWSLSAKTHASS